jgi:hypothetical protein
MNRDLHALELDKILDKLAGETCCSAAADMARSLRPATQPSLVQRLLDETDDACRLIGGFGSPSFGQLADVSNPLRRAEAGACLSLGELLRIGETLRIIRSIISMAKDISMVTVVEGVETQEQVDFLKAIGCDRMQGYFFSRPLPYQELLKVLEEKGIPFETEEDRQYYHEINRINLLSPSPFTILETGKEKRREGIPLAILEKHGDEFNFIYQDLEFRDSLNVLGAVDAMDAMQKLIHFGILTHREIDDFIDTTISKGEREMTFKVHGDLCSAHGKLLSARRGRQAILLSINNITQSINISHEQLLDQSLMNIYSMYHRVSILRPGKDEIVTVFTQDHHGITTDVPHSMNGITQYFANLAVHEQDRAAYLAFLDSATLENRIKDSKRGFINTKIRTQDADGNYTRKMYLAVASGNHEIILLVRYANL